MLGLKLHWQEDVCRKMPVMRRKWYVERSRKQDDADKKAMHDAQNK